MAPAMMSFVKMFKKSTSNIIGMIHLGATPGSPGSCSSVKALVKQAEYDARLYKNAGLDGVLVENMHDVPYLHTADVGPEVVAVMTLACARVRDVFTTGPVGVQILAGANRQALAVALATGLDFVRVEGFVYGHVADEGIMDACAGPLLRYRRLIGAEDISIFTDIKKKHSAHAITADVSIAETARAAEFFRSDGVIVTGSSTGVAADVHQLTDVQQAVDIPVLVGSGVTPDNYVQYQSANAIIIGSHFKHGGFWENRIDKQRVLDFMDLVRSQAYIPDVHDDIQ